MVNTSTRSPFQNIRLCLCQSSLPIGIKKFGGPTRTNGSPRDGCRHCLDLSSMLTSPEFILICESTDQLKNHSAYHTHNSGWPSLVAVDLACKLIRPCSDNQLILTCHFQWLQVFAARNEWVGFKSPSLDVISYNTFPTAEVVLSLLIEAFKFSPPKEEIEWLMNGIASPVVKGLNDGNSMMPLLVEKI